jgi:hypothetical protein
VGVAALFERVARDPVLAIDFGPAEGLGHALERLMVGFVARCGTLLKGRALG